MGKKHCSISSHGSSRTYYIIMIKFEVGGLGFDH